MIELETLLEIQQANTLNAAAQITLRNVRTLDEFRQCEELQARIWGADDIVGVPTLVLLTAQENGGIVIGAFLNDTQLIGFVYSFPGLTHTGYLKQCSVIMGVDPAYQACGLGYYLKHAQREAALAMGIDYITWTFDPLASVNAYLNLYKLGAVSSKYLVNVYGEGHGLNAGLETDRLLVDWWLKDRKVTDHALNRSGPVGTPFINQVKVHPLLGMPVNACVDLGLTDEILHLEIPGNLQAMKARDLSLAKAWRFEVREIFRTYFARGYAVGGFCRNDGTRGFRPYYVLKRGGSA